MRHRIFTILLGMALAYTFTACSSDSGGGTTTTPVDDTADFSLALGASATCTTASSFTVVPTSDPVVTFTTDADSGDTTILVDANSPSGSSVLVQDCTKR